MNANEMAEQVLGAFKGYLNKALDPLRQKLIEIESRQPERGEKGDAGKDGVDGRDGTNGEKGADGRDGIDGKDGKDADVDVIRQIVLTTVMNEVRQPQDGKDGAKGEQGERGIDGQNGKDGRDGVDGKDGINGEKGEKGIDGKDGRDGQAGRDGDHGRDALQIEVIDIDVERAYPRGVYGTYRGGLLRSLRTTDPLENSEIERAGWQIIMNGVADIQVEQKDHRLFEIRSLMTSGKAMTHTVKVPVVIDRGVYQKDTRYEVGDGTTWGGSFWIAQKDTTDKPGEGDGWRLAVKRGRDGKDGAKGDRGGEGPKGRDGRDLTQQNFDGSKY